jgi:hypothetical protein
MKKLLPILLTALMLSSCVTYHWQIGQTETEFFAMNHNRYNRFQMIRQSTEWTVYRVGGDNGTEPIYFYFHYDKLYQVDRGRRSPDLIIENR